MSTFNQRHNRSAVYAVIVVIALFNTSNCLCFPRFYLTLKYS